MAKTKRLSEFVEVRSRYRRSVSLVRDWGDDRELLGYILTPSGRAVLERMSASLGGASAARCWSLIGPYGSGKSAFALFVAKMLSLDVRRRSALLSLLGVEHEPIWEKLFGKGRGKRSGLLPIVVGGGRESINRALLLSLSRALEPLPGTPKVRGLRRRVASLSKEGEVSQSTKALVEIYEEVAESVSHLGTGHRGVLLVIDELGKFLEHAASHPGDGDIFVLQELAELAARRKEPFLILTVLHQSLDHYAENLSQSRRAEWQKIQGRYEDVAFEEATAQVLRLVANAVRYCGEKNERPAFQESTDRVVRCLLPLASSVSGVAEKELHGQLNSCTPLHPLSALSLGPLFRRLAQNERSLFAFLTSSEPFGFQEFLNGTDVSRQGTPLYQLHQLYDYVSSALGSSLFAQHRGRLWAEIESALERLKGALPLEQQVTKSVGLLQVLGYGAGMPASKAVLCAALQQPKITAKKVEEAIASLEKRSILVYRRHADSYALWEGSDVDLEAKLKDAKRHVDPSKGLATYLSSHVPLRPLVAKSHSFRTGTLRYFEACYVDGGSIGSSIEAGFGDADGRVIYCVPASSEERRSMLELLTSPKAAKQPGLIAVLPADVLDLRDACIELGCLRWVTEHTPELAGDATARRELRARIASAEQQVGRELERCFAPGSTSQSGSWYWKGKKLRLDSPRKLQVFASEICDKLYPATPILRNEMVNRRSLSSSAAAARRNLIEAMIERHDKPFLGIEGTPAERSMYDCVLKLSGLHREKDEVWGFFPPSRRKDSGIVEVWKEIDGFLGRCERERQSISALFDVLRLPPYGLKDGVLPILLASALLYFDSEVALYEQGSFVPMLTTAVFERMLRTPGDYEVQRCRIAGPRAEVFNQYASLVAAKSDEILGDKPRLLSVVRPLFRFVRQLPEYVSKTEQISAVARNVLRAIRETKEPDQLLFTDLPAACGVSPFPSRGALKPKETEQFFGELRAALGELQQAYPKLQAKIEELLFKAFSLERPLVQARLGLVHRCKLVSELAVDQKLKAFVTRVLDPTPDDALWLESIAAMLGNKPSIVWNDQDAARFEVVLAMTARTLGHFEALAYEMERSGAAILDGDATAFRVCITAFRGEDVARVLRIPTRLRDSVNSAHVDLRRVLEAAGLLEDPDLGVAVLTDLARELLSQTAIAGEA
ncbi:MAG: hypothetical protein WD490_04525 [Opitutales bacterium]